MRVEDTDEERSTGEMVQGILEGLAWLGIDWDEGPFFQSERKDLYRSNAQKLLESGHAYRCFCTREMLEKRKKSSGKEGRWGYDRMCLVYPREESDRRAEAGEPFVLRFLIPPGTLEWRDVVKGLIRFDCAEVEDFVLLRSDGTPTYHLSVVSDDLDMGITHVIRGEDHVSNTPKQIALYRAFGKEPPVFAHLPLILGPDKKKLSKRHGVTSVTSYRDEGILSLALFNFLAQLGANLGEETFLTKSEILGRFDFDALKPAPSVFDVERLLWMNGQVLGETPDCELRILLQPFLEAEGIGSEAPERAVAVMKTRARDLKDLAARVAPFILSEFELDAKGLSKAAKKPESMPALERLEKVLSGLSDTQWTPEGLEAELRKCAGECGVKAGTLIHPVRLFLTGRTESPGIFDVLWAMGREGTLYRLSRGLGILADRLAKTRSVSEEAAGPGQ